MDFNITEAEASRIVVEVYGLTPKSVKPILGCVAQNFVIALDEDASSPDQARNLVMKVSFTEKENVSENFELQHVMQRHLAADGVMSAQPILTKDGNTIAKFTNDKGKEYMVQLLTFLEGVAVVEAALTKHDTRTLAYKIGKFVARMHKSLLTLQCDAWTSYPGSDYNAENAHTLRKKLAYVKDDKLKPLLVKVFDLFETNFLPRLLSLRRTFAHDDLSNGNIIVQKAEEWEIVGLIDFEDCYYGYIVGDLGICIAYMLLQAGSIPDINVINIAGRVIRGYEEILPLESDEKDVLYEVILSRIVVSYLIGCEKVYYDPGNSKFWLRQSLHAPAVLREITEASRDVVQSEWFQY